MPSLDDVLSYEWEQNGRTVVCTVDACLPRSAAASPQELEAVHAGTDRHGRSTIELRRRQQVGSSDAPSSDAAGTSQLLGSFLLCGEVEDDVELTLEESPTGPLLVLGLTKVAEATPAAAAAAASAAATTARATRWCSFLAHEVPLDERGDLASDEELDALCRAELANPADGSEPLLDPDSTIHTVLDFHSAVMRRALQGGLNGGAVAPPAPRSDDEDDDATSSPSSSSSSASSSAVHPEVAAAASPAASSASPRHLLQAALRASSMGECKALLGDLAARRRYAPAVLALCAHTSLILPERYLWLLHGATVLRDARCLLALADLYQLGEDLPEFKSVGLALTQRAAVLGHTPSMRRLGASWDFAADVRGGGSGEGSSSEPSSTAGSSPVASVAAATRAAAGVFPACAGSDVESEGRGGGGGGGGGCGTALLGFHPATVGAFGLAVAA
eukprot:Rhum_TRINITY_DN14112_c2_g1::Rhum_TRINITY_DN14112_c2_g1_i1::g.69587::m.69587